MRQPGRAVARIAVAAVLGASLAAAVPMPLGGAGAGGLALVLALPPILALAGLLYLARALLGRQRRAGMPLPRMMAAPAQLQVIVAGAIVVFGVYGANTFLTELPFGRVTLWAYAVVMGAALVSALVLRWSFERSGLWLRLRQIPEWQATAATSALLGAAAVLSDTVILPGGLPRLHLICLLVALLGFSLAGSLVTWHVPLSRLAVVAAVAALLVAAPGWVAGPSVQRLALQTPPTLHTQLLDRARSLLDRDGDGFSAALDGGDCDDTDASVYPLSLRGRDCLGWNPSGASGRALAGAGGAGARDRASHRRAGDRRCLPLWFRPGQRGWLWRPVSPDHRTGPAGARPSGHAHALSQHRERGARPSPGWSFVEGTGAGQLAGGRRVPEPRRHHAPGAGAGPGDQDVLSQPG